MRKSIFILMAVVLGMTACTKEEVMRSSSTNTSDILTINSPDNTSWDESKKDCVPVTENVCCSRPVTEFLNPQQVALHNSFKSAYTNGTLDVFFATEPYADLWPGLAFQQPVVDGIVNGSLKVNLVPNQNSNIDYYLIGDVNLSNAQIELDPTWVLFVD
jgi:hypothetical protein